MNKANWKFILLVGLAAAVVRAEEQTTDDNGPIINHVPVLTVIRGQPASLSATITAREGVITSATARVKLAPAGKPVEFPMTPGKDHVFQTAVPLSLIQPVDRFWYYLHAGASNGRSEDTHWFEVRIVDAGSGGAAELDSSHRGAWWIAGGALAAGGVAVAVIANNNDSGDDNNDPPAEATPAATPPKKKRPATSNNDNNDSPEVVVPPCILTGAEQVSYRNLDPFLASDPIEVLVCNTCPDATISATASWGPSASIPGYNNPLCIDTDRSLVLFLSKPGQIPSNCEVETIQVFVNGQLIETLPWPDCGTFNP